MTLCYLLLSDLVFGSHVGVNVGDKHLRAQFPPGFASVTIDFHPGSKGPTWGVNASILEVDLTDPSLKNYASALAPAILRLGGSEAGSMLMYTGFPKDNLVCPKKFYYCLSRERWDTILQFAKETGVRLMLDLNLIGPNKTADWQAQLSNIGSLFAYTAEKGVDIPAWEVGNENQGDLTPKAAAQRIKQVRELLDAAWPDPQQRPLLIGPSVHINTDWIIDFLDEIDDATLSVFSYHLYPGYGGSQEIIQQMATGAFLDDSRALVEAATWAAHSVKPSLPLMVTETAAAWCSGVSGGTNAFVSDFWYLDQLATAALNGHIAFARQTLIGGNYSLIDQNHDFRANPDFFVAKLWRELVEGDSQKGRILQCSRQPVISGDVHHGLRSYAFCGENNSLLLGLVNTGTDNLTVDVKFDDNAVSGQGKREEFVLQVGRGDTSQLQSRHVTLNGKPIEAVMGRIPKLMPRVIDDGSNFQALAQSVSFVRFRVLFPAACSRDTNVSLKHVPSQLIV